MSIDIGKLIQGNRRQLAKAITLIESKKDSDHNESQKILEEVLTHTGKSIRIGISGTPGVGKSTFIESLGLHLIKKNLKVAVLAVDPSSPISGGSIMGDKTRMEKLSQEDNAFIRPSPSGGSLGGVAQKTRETMLLCEAAGYDVILVETVGVGQSEYEVASMVDFFSVLLLPNAGDELQGIKRGIMELADTIIINKADGDALDQAQRSLTHYQGALDLLQKQSFWKPKAITCSALEHKGIDQAWDLMNDFHKEALENKYLHEKRSLQNKAWMKKLVFESIERRVQGDDQLKKLWSDLEDDVSLGKTTAYIASQKIISKIL